MTELRTISLGAGVQSTTMALMAAHGELTPMPDVAIFADTGWEPRNVYEHLAWLMEPGRLPFPVEIVSAGNIREDLLKRASARGGRFVTIPAFLKHPKGNDGLGRRQCTTHYKVEPLMKRLREILGKGPRERIPAGAVETWIGISVDEIFRATPSKVAYQVKRFPLIEARMHRRHCLAWLEAHGYPRPPKSACVGCPYHGNAQWRAIRDLAPDEWAEAVEVDAAIRVPISRPDVPDMRAEQFLHRSLLPLAEVDLRTDEEAGQPDLFNNECEGMCGV